MKHLTPPSLHPFNPPGGTGAEQRPTRKFAGLRVKCRRAEGATNKGREAADAVLHALAELQAIRQARQ